MLYKVGIWGLGLSVVSAILLHVSVSRRLPVLVYGDSQDYVHIAEGIGDSSVKISDMAIQRVPGYSLLLWLAKKVWHDRWQDGIVLIQHCLGFLTQLAALWLGWILSANLLFACGLFLLSALSLDMLIFQNAIMTDSLYSFLVASGMCIFVYGLARNKRSYGLITVFIFSVSAWVRPVGNLLWTIPFAFLVVLLINDMRLPGLVGEGRRQKGERFTWRQGVRNGAVALLALVIVAIVIFPLAWKNRDRTGNLSLVGGWGMATYYWFMTPEMQEKMNILSNPEIIKYIDDYEKWKNGIQIRYERVTTDDDVLSETPIGSDHWFYSRYVKSVRRVLNGDKEWWSNHNVAVSVMMDRRGWSYERAIEWMTRVSTDLIRSQWKTYFWEVLGKLYPFFTNTSRLVHREIRGLDDGEILKLIYTGYVRLHSFSWFRISYFTLFIGGCFLGFFTFKKKMVAFILMVVAYHVGIAVLLLTGGSNGAPHTRHLFPAFMIIHVMVLSGPYCLFKMLRTKPRDVLKRKEGE